MINALAGVLLGRSLTDDGIPPEALLAAYPKAMRRVAEMLLGAGITRLSRGERFATLASGQ
ncbi:MAG TPA: hypothetical protein VIM30_17785 [Candidatus Limnocylindrales bacterium]|jgi:hypothetical protein